MTRGIKGHPGHCKKKGRYNWKFTINPLTKSEQKTIKNSDKRQRIKKIVCKKTPKYTNYEIKRISVEWDKYNSDKHGVYYVHPITNRVFWRYKNEVPLPLTYYQNISQSEIAKINHVWTYSRPILVNEE
jgi:hypothetical protein